MITIFQILKLLVSGLIVYVRLFSGQRGRRIREQSVVLPPLPIVFILRTSLFQSSMLPFHCHLPFFLIQLMFPWLSAKPIAVPSLFLKQEIGALSPHFPEFFTVTHIGKPRKVVKFQYSFKDSQHNLSRNSPRVGSSSLDLCLITQPDFINLSHILSISVHIFICWNLCSWVSLHWIKRILSNASSIFHFYLDPS